MATSTAQISGLSGFDGASLVEQLMQLEGITQRNLQTRVKNEQSVVTTLQALNTSLVKLGEQAKALADASTWTALTATSSNAAITATAGSTAQATTLDVTVVRLALSHQVAFRDTAALTDTIFTGASTDLVLDKGGVSSTIATDGTLQGTIDAINARPELGVRATAVSSGTGYKLLVESTTTGAAEQFTLAAADGAAVLGGSTPRLGQDAEISLGAMGVTSATNTFTDLVPGVNLTLGAGAAGATSTINVARDSGALKDSVKALVDAANAILTTISTQTAYDADKGSGGKLLGDSTVRALRSALVESIYPGDGTSMASVGIQVDRYGKLVLDDKKFSEAYTADPAATAAVFTGGTGFAGRLEAVTKTYSDPYDGMLTQTITGRNSTIDRLEDSIDAWDLRLELRRTTLSRQFVALETALATMNGQASWLTSQISSLPSYNR